jgi:hypothetical protein
MLTEGCNCIGCKIMRDIEAEKEQSKRMWRWKQPTDIKADHAWLYEVIRKDTFNITGEDWVGSNSEGSVCFTDIPKDWLEEVFFCAECGEEIDYPKDFIHNQYLGKDYHEKCWESKSKPTDHAKEWVDFNCPHHAFKESVMEAYKAGQKDPEFRYTFESWCAEYQLNPNDKLLEFKFTAARKLY